MPAHAGKKSGDLEGQVFADRYLIKRRIGEGGMGMVYEAEDSRSDNRICAIKVLHRDVSNDEKAVRRFFSEARVLSSLQHPNIIKLYDFGRSEDKRLYIAMELLNGRPADVLIKYKQLTPLDALQILDQASAGLGEAHLQGVIHRDLKPANIFVTKKPDGSLFVTVLDFGIAKISGGQNLTVTGKVMGTPSYMAPEQIMGKQPDPRTDIYALGAMGYELICGQPPFVSDTPLTLLYSHLNDIPASLMQLAPPGSICKPLADILFTFLAKDPDHRPRNTVELRKLLEPFLANPELITSGDIDPDELGPTQVMDSNETKAQIERLKQMNNNAAKPAATRVMDSPAQAPTGGPIVVRPNTAATAQFNTQQPAMHSGRTPVAPTAINPGHVNAGAPSPNRTLLWVAIFVVAILLAAALAIVVFLVLSQISKSGNSFIMPDDIRLARTFLPGSWLTHWSC